MHRTAKLYFVSGLALFLACGTALADAKSTSKNRKLGFFASIFGEPSTNRVERQKRRRNMFGRDQFNDDFSDGSVRIIRGGDASSSRNNSRNIVSVDEDPEGDPGFGMGNLPYVAAKLVPLTGQKLNGPRPETVDSGQIYDALSDAEAAMRVLPEIRDALVAHYQAQNFKPMWIVSGKLSPRAVAVLKVLSDADSDGLEATSYLPSTLTAFDAIIPESDIAAMSRLDIEIGAMALRYARDASGGQFEPGRLSLYHDVKPERVASTQSIKVLGWSPYAAEYLTSLHPSHPAYAAMKSALAELRKIKTEPNPAAIADGAIVKKGGSDERIPAIRQRLADLGYPEAMNAASDEEILDADLSVQLRLFQKASGIKITGALGPQTVKALNSDNSGRDMARLLDNMERMRWLPKSLGTRHVFVNQPAFQVRLMDHGKPIWTSRVIVGKPLTQTSVFHDEMETVVFNPSWGVPSSIIANEYLPKLRRDPGYLDRIGFKVVNDKGKVVSSRSVSWGSYGSKVPFGIQQPPGVKNALGEIKFLFPNAHNIYMHDTPNRELFDNEVRAFSHGCVRVQNPREFASALLGWDAAKVDANVESKASATVRLPVKIPVHITYFTAWPDETGKIQYFNDIYGRDKAMETARVSTVLAAR